MSNKRRNFERPLGERRYRRLFVIAVEGVKTEPQYFSIFNDSEHNIIRVKCLKANNRSSPPQVLKRMKTYLQNESLKKSDEAWLVVDQDEWSEDQLQQLFNWSMERDNYGFALSNPNFEYWLLLHFEEGGKISSGADCVGRLKQYLPEYNKAINLRKLTTIMISDAILRAKKRDNPRCTDWPRTTGQSTVYRLVEKLIQRSLI